MPEAARAIVISQDEFGGCYLVGAWPKVMLADPHVIPLVAESFPSNGLRVGDDFVIRLANGHAQYRYVADDDFGNLRCSCITSKRD